jgi:hypothetical protein
VPPLRRPVMCAAGLRNVPSARRHLEGHEALLPAGIKQVNFNSLKLRPQRQHVRAPFSTAPQHVDQAKPHSGHDRSTALCFQPSYRWE